VVVVMTGLTGVDEELEDTEMEIALTGNEEVVLV